MSDDTTITPQKPHICIATPCYGGQVFQNYFLSCMNFFRVAQARGDIEVSFVVRGGDSLITRARNSITAEFLSNPSFTHLLWIDADIGFRPEAIYRLLYSNHPIAAGVYPLKAFSWPEEIPAMSKEDLMYKYIGYPFNPIGNTFRVENDFVEVKDAPTGLMMIKREVLEQMIKAYPNLKYNPDNQVGLESIAGTINDYYYNFFDTFIDDTGRYLSEDYAFCRLWQQIGGKVYVDSKSKLSHTGQFVYQGDFDKMLSYRFTRTPDPQPGQAPPPPVAPVAPAEPAPALVLEGGIVSAPKTVSDVEVTITKPKKKK
jgi:hypothetical protein